MAQSVISNIWTKITTKCRCTPTYERFLNMFPKVISGIEYAITTRAVYSLWFWLECFGWFITSHVSIMKCEDTRSHTNTQVPKHERWLKKTLGNYQGLRQTKTQQHICLHNCTVSLQKYTHQISYIHTIFSQYHNNIRHAPLTWVTNKVYSIWS